MSIDEQLAILQATKDKRKVQVNALGTWYFVDDGHFFDFQHSKYRIADEPRECWRNQYPSGWLADVTWNTREEAKSSTAEECKQILFREVLEDKE